MTAEPFTPPHSLDAEQAVLGAVLLSDRILEPLLTETGLRAEHFYRPAHQAVFAAMTAMHDTGEPVDPLTLTSRLTAAGALDVVGGKGELEALAAAVPMVGNVRSYARTVIAEHTWRQRLEANRQQLDAITRRDEDGYNAAETALAGTGRADTATATPDDLAAEFLEWYDDPGDTAIPTPWPAVTRLLRGGLRAGDTTIVAGWTSMGKSVVVDQLLEHAAERGRRCHAYLNEMSRVDRTARVLARRTGVPFARIAGRELAPLDTEKVVAAAAGLPFGITVCAGWSAEDIARHVRRYRWDLAVVDLVTRIPAERTADWDRISGVLTDAARMSGCHLLMVCQLNQERLKTLIKPPPVNRDLRNTGAWANDAANVLFVHREQEEVLDNLGDGTGLVRTLPDGHLRLDKARNGEPGAVPVSFDARWMRFRENTELRAVA